MSIVINNHTNLLRIGVLLLQGPLLQPVSPAWASQLYHAAPSIKDICKGSNSPTMEDMLDARKRGQEWLDKIGDAGFFIASFNDKAEYEDKTLRREGQPDYRIINIHAYEGDWPTTLFFNEPVNSDMTPAEVQARLASFALEGFPTPGLEIYYWKTRAQVPRSHLTEGIEILEVAKGHIRFRVETSFFALYGYDTRMPNIQDIATPPEAYFSLERSFSGIATITFKVKDF